MINVFICGGSGYTGVELLRILYNHPNVTVTGVSSEKSAGKSVTDLFPSLHKYSNLVYEPLIPEKILSRADLFFMSLPHSASQEAVAFFYEKGKKVIDLSADYRIKDPSVYEKWYGVKHSYKSILKKAVYGLPELYRENIRGSSLVANPGCYPTGAILGLYPILKKRIIDVSSIIIDSKSGVSGAGRKSDISLSFCEVNEGFKAYAVGVHRHTPEIEQEISRIYRQQIKIIFTPHLLPVDRGILTTIYLKILEDISPEELYNLYEKTYKGEPFVKVLKYGTYPNIMDVRGTNYCEIGFKLINENKSLIIITAIDNLVKGASGQAVQNMNIMFGFKEIEGLDSLALFP